MRRLHSFGIALVTLLTGCGRGGFSGFTHTNIDSVIDRLTLTITEPSAGALVPSVMTARGVCNIEEDVRLVYGGDIVPTTGDGCSDGMFARAVTFVAGDGVREVTVSAAGASGVVVSDARAFRRTTAAPVLTLDDARDGVLELFAATDQHTFTGTCETGVPIDVAGAELASLTCVDGVWSYTTPALTDDVTVVTVLSQTDQAGNTTSVQASFTRDTQPPVIQSFVVNNGAARASGNVLPVTLTARDEGSGIGGYRISSQGDVSSLGWIPTTPPTFTFPLTSGTYALHAQVSDRAGNVSVVRQSSAVVLDIGMPPLVNIVSPTVTQAYVTGDSVFVAWNITTPSGNALISAPVRVHYTLDDGISTTSILAGLPNNPGACPAGSTGCTSFQVPSAIAGRPFRLVVLADDEIGATGAASTLPFNTQNGLRLLAGRNARAVGQSALSTAFETYGAMARDPRTGDIYLAAGGGYVIYKVDAATGLMTHWAGRPNVRGGTGRTVARTDLRFFLTGTRRARMGSIAVDHASNVYVSSEKGVWKCSDTQCTLIVGADAGGSTASGTAASSFAWSMVNYAKLDLTANDQLYLYLSVNACYEEPDVIGCISAYRLEADNTLTLLAGTDDITKPVASATVHGSLDVRVGSFHLVDDGSGAPRLFAGGNPIGETTQPYYEVRNDGNMNRIGTIRGQELLSYDVSRKVLGYFDGSAIAFVDPNAPAATFAKMPSTYGGVAVLPGELIIDEYGGAYLTPESNDSITYWPLGSTTYSEFAGAPINSPVTVPARFANLRGITQIAAYSSTALVFHSTLSRDVRVLYADDTTQILPVGNSIISTGPVRYVMRDGNTSGMFDVSNTCVYFCAGTVTSSANWLGFASSGDAFSKGAAMVGYAGARYQVATDSGNTYLFVYTTDGAYIRSFIKRIDASGQLTNVAGNLSLTDIPVGDKSATGKLNTSQLSGGAMASVHAGSMDSSRGTALQASSQGLFAIASNRLVSAVHGGPWKQLALNTYTFAKHPAWDRVFYLDNSTRLHRIALGTDLSVVTDTIVADLSGVLGTQINGLSFNAADPTRLLFATDSQMFSIPVTEN